MNVTNYNRTSKRRKKLRSKISGERSRRRWRRRGAVTSCQPEEALFFWLFFISSSVLSSFRPSGSGPSIYVVNISRLFTSRINGLVLVKSGRLSSCHAMPSRSFWIRLIQKGRMAALSFGVRRVHPSTHPLDDHSRVLCVGRKLNFLKKKNIKLIFAYTCILDFLKFLAALQFVYNQAIVLIELTCAIHWYLHWCSSQIPLHFIDDPHQISSTAVPKILN